MRERRLSLRTSLNSGELLICLSAAPRRPAERRLWLTLSDMKEKDKVFLMDALLAPSGLFGDAVKFCRRQVTGGP